MSEKVRFPRWWSGAVPRVLQSVRFRIGMLRPSRRRAMRELQRRHLEFDRRHGVDTAGIEAIRARGSSHYWPVDERDFHAAFEALPIGHEQYTFVDFGSGKGKALLLAAQYPFRRIVGIELAAHLHALAEANLRRLADPRVEARCADATAVELEAEPTVFFFFNPFDAPIMQRVVERIGAWAATARQPFYVVYIRPHQLHVWTCACFVEPFATAPGWVVLRGTQAGG